MPKPYIRERASGISCHFKDWPMSMHRGNDPRLGCNITALVVVAVTGQKTAAVLHLWRSDDLQSHYCRVSVTIGSLLDDKSAEKRMLWTINKNTMYLHMRLCNVELYFTITCYLRVAHFSSQLQYRDFSQRFGKGRIFHVAQVLICFGCWADCAVNRPLWCLASLSFTGSSLVSTRRVEK